VERGEKSISIDSLYKISVALRVPLSVLSDVGTSRRSVPNGDSEKILALAYSAARSGREVIAIRESFSAR
jgi:hypothetical protein